MTPISPLLALDLALRGALVACLLLLGGRLWWRQPQAPVARLGGLLALGLSAYVLNTWSGAPLPRPVWQAPLLALGAGNAVVFWLFCRALFDDAARWLASHAAAWAGVAGLALLNCYALAPAQSPWAAGVGVLLDSLPLLFAALALGEALSTWRADLVERRRRLRWFIVLGGVAYTVLSLLGRWWWPGAAGGPRATADLALLATLVGTVAWRLLEVPAGDLLVGAARPVVMPVAEVDGRPVVPLRAEAAPDPSPEPPDQAEAQLATDLHTLMAEVRIYREDSLTIGGLAARLGVPEYRLRRLINQRLGHRNFNAFVNGWRLAEARRALADPAQAERPVLDIALDAGFQSIGPFNRAFKADTGLTPTEFRRQPPDTALKLADF